MRALLAVLAVMGLSACEQHPPVRYQIVANTAGSVWRLDTKTGELGLCGVEIGSSPQRLICITHLASAPK